MNKNLNWKFDASTFRLLGRDLITDRVTAVVELVKNCYDANAKRVDIEFRNADSLEFGKIIIRDDGIGMSSSDIADKWMRIGTNSKRTNKFSPKPFNRRVVGEKGVGRFAIDKLGDYCHIYTKTKEENHLNLLIIDWRQYYEENKENTDFTSIDNIFKTKSFFNPCSGTKIKITHIHDIWTNDDLKLLYRELSKIVSPFNKLFPPFDIYIQAENNPEFGKAKLVTNSVIRYATESFEINYDFDNKTQDVIKFNKENGRLEVEKEEIKIFGPIRFRVYYFNKGAKGNFAKNYKGSEILIDGIKIYRDGILTTPFAEYENNQDLKRDIFGLDKRRWSGFFDKVSTRDIIGIIEITKDKSPNIIDATNRQHFISNKEFKKLRDFVISQIYELEKLLSHKKQENKHTYSKNLKKAKTDLYDFSSKIQEIKSSFKENKTEHIQIQKDLDLLEEKAKKAHVAIEKGLREKQKEEREQERKESMFLSLMSLQTYALEITHIIKTSLGHIKRRALFNNKHIDTQKRKQIISKYSKEIVLEVDKLDKAIDFMSTYTRSEKNWTAFDIKTTINNTFEAFMPLFKSKQIRTVLHIESNLIIEYNDILFQDVIKNLISNSIKAVSQNDGDKIIKVSAYSNNKEMIIIFSDNGTGISDEDKNKIYEIYYTTTADEGGNGMGLYMVKTNIEAISGSIEVINSELDSGATFEIRLPFKNEK